MRRLLALVGAVVLTGCASTFSIPGRMAPTEIVVGGQAAIDAGHVTNLTGCWPGQGCTIVLAGHRTTHGAVFAQVATLTVGSRVQIFYNGNTYNYRVTSKRIVCCQGDHITWPSVPLVLVTSVDSSRSYLITATNS